MSWIVVYYLLWSGYSRTVLDIDLKPKPRIRDKPRISVLGPDDVGN